MSLLHRLSPLLIVIMLVSPGCTIPTFSNPLIDPANAEALPELHGAYRSADGPTNMVLFAHVGSAGEGFPKGFLRIILVNQPKNSSDSIESATLVGFVEKIGRYHILHMPVPKSLKLDDNEQAWGDEWGAQDVDGYNIVRLSVSADGVAIADLNNDFIAERINENMLEGRVSQEIAERSDGTTEFGRRSITITAESQDLRRFFDRHIDGDLFRPSDRKYIRVN